MPSIPTPTDANRTEALGASGSAMRDMAVVVLELRRAELTLRSTHQLLTPVEQAELDRLRVVVDTLQAMAVSQNG